MMMEKILLRNEKQVVSPPRRGKSRFPDGGGGQLCGFLRGRGEPLWRGGDLCFWVSSWGGCCRRRRGEGDGVVAEPFASAAGWATSAIVVVGVVDVVGGGGGGCGVD